MEIVNWSQRQVQQYASAALQQVQAYTSDALASETASDALQSIVDNVVRGGEAHAMRETAFHCDWAADMCPTKELALTLKKSALRVLASGVGGTTGQMIGDVAACMPNRLVEVVSYQRIDKLADATDILCRAVSHEGEPTEKALASAAVEIPKQLTEAGKPPRVLSEYQLQLQALKFMSHQPGEGRRPCAGQDIGDSLRELSQHLHDGPLSMSLGDEWRMVDALKARAC